MGLSARAEKFAVLVASGQTKIDAYNQAYRSRGAPRSSRRRDASELSRRPRVAERIAFYQAQMIPIDDLRNLQQSMLKNLHELAREAPDARTRLAATMMLFDICEQRLAAAKTEIRAADLEELVREVISSYEEHPQVYDEVVTEGAVQPAEASSLY
jgi:hypothetical protein